MGNKTYVFSKKNEKLDVKLSLNVESKTFDIFQVNSDEISICKGDFVINSNKIALFPKSFALHIKDESSVNHFLTPNSGYHFEKGKKETWKYSFSNKFSELFSISKFNKEQDITYDGEGEIVTDEKDINNFDNLKKIKISLNFNPDLTGFGLNPDESLEIFNLENFEMDQEIN